MSALQLLTHPLTTRFRFKFRPLSTFLIIWFVFTAITFALVRWKWALAVEVILIGFFFYLNFFVLHKRPIAVTCSKGHYINTNTPWICGFCNKKNENVDDFPFAHRCQHCSAEPKAYKCHHCDETIYLTRDHLDHGYARCSSVPLPQKVDERKSKRDEVAENIRDAQLNAQYAEKARERAEREREQAEAERKREEAKDPNTKYRRELKEFLDGLRTDHEKRLAIDELAEEWRNKIKENKNLSEEEKERRLEEIERRLEEIRMTHF